MIDDRAGLPRALHPGGWVDFLDLIDADLPYEEQDRIAEAAISQIEAEQPLA